MLVKVSRCVRRLPSSSGSSGSRVGSHRCGPRSHANMGHSLLAHSWDELIGFAVRQLTAPSESKYYLRDTRTPMQDALKKMREEANIPAVKTVLAIADELALQGWENVTELNLKNRGLGVDEALRLSVVLEKLVNLRTLNLEGNPIGQEGARAIARVIRDHGNLQHIDVEDCGIGKIGFRSLISALQPLKPPGPRSLAIVTIQRPVPVITLDLEGNGIDSTYCEIFGRALRMNKTWVDIDLEDNNIDDAGGIFIARALLHNSSVKRLDLSNNEIGDKTAETFVKVLRQSKNGAKLEYLNLSSNFIGEAMIKDLIAAVKSNKHIKDLLLNNNLHRLTGEEQSELDGYLQRNREGKFDLSKPRKEKAPKEPKPPKEKKVKPPRSDRDPKPKRTPKSKANEDVETGSVTVGVRKAATPKSPKVPKTPKEQPSKEAKPASESLPSKSRKSIFEL